ncbi:uncharacterized protein LOC6539870 [Drosophila yakuba]|uniref:Uncharacterized protein n=1 Tax=Drosophila yakuba TaxID=7245 RepID=B4IUU1_DROYA|nr:uncharacterized protein LOC6539870 [Drosophila yakuba]EDW96396.1 uncharacterized protein Dyak_GE25807 [Drosophila yakuba]EDX00155.1 uncharacterized protein Dyak_GE11121 [Drosophila yakuba]
MDISKAESQTPVGERRSANPDYLRTLLQDILCFLVLLSVALLIVAGILFVVEDVSRLQQQHQHQQYHHHHHRHMRPDQIGNDLKGSPIEEAPRELGQIFRPHTWIRFFNCRNKIPQQQQEDVEREVVQFGPKQDAQQIPVDDVPTYHPAIERMPLSAGGDYNKKLDPEPHHFLANNIRT